MQALVKVSAKPGIRWMVQLGTVALCAMLFIYGYSNTLATAYGPLAASSSGHMHVLVTGCAGFIGSHASLRLLEDGHAVTCVDNFSRGNKGAVRAVKKGARARLR